MLVEVDDTGVDQHLHDHGRGHDGRHAQFHERAPVRGQDCADVVELVRTLVDDFSAIQWNLGRYELNY